MNNTNSTNANSNVATTLSTYPSGGGGGNRRSSLGDHSLGDMSLRSNGSAGSMGSTFTATSAFGSTTSAAVAPPLSFAANSGVGAMTSPSPSSSPPQQSQQQQQQHMFQQMRLQQQHQMQLQQQMQRQGHHPLSPVNQQQQQQQQQQLPRMSTPTNMTPGNHQQQQQQLHQQQHQQLLQQRSRGGITGGNPNGALMLSPGAANTNNSPSANSTGSHRVSGMSMFGLSPQPLQSPQQHQHHRQQQHQPFTADDTMSPRPLPPSGLQSNNIAHITNDTEALRLPPPPLSALSAPPQQVTQPMPSAPKISSSTSSATNTAPTLNATPSLAHGSAPANSEHIPTEQVAMLLANCDWIDKTAWASRQLLGGQAVNGFLRATATVQRIKKQRARQNVKSGVTAKKVDTEGTSSSSYDVQQAEEEVLKSEIMNARTAKKIKTELESGIQFCTLLHDTIRSIIYQMDPSIPPIEPLRSSRMKIPPTSRNSNLAPATQQQATTLAHMSNETTASHRNMVANASIPSLSSTSGTATVPSNLNSPPISSNMSSPQSTISASGAGNSAGSTLRRHRKAKLPVSGEVIVQLPEFDEVTGKRTCTKKEHTHRVSELLRFRALRQGDSVAARVSSRDLWILARVLKDYPGIPLAPPDFLRLSASRRDQVFKDKVLIQDVEEHDGAGAKPVFVSRSLILPLPRSVAEAAEWGNQYRFFKKGTRVYAMYPQTTSLYTAAVVDSTNYCRGDEDIIVVEFDGDDPESEMGKIPTCHIPARFVTLIPREFPGAQTPMTTGGMNRSKAAAESDPLMEGALDDINFDGDLPGLDNFDDLDFDM